jgi:DNA-binding transcriptional LysR family regulator
VQYGIDQFCSAAIQLCMTNRLSWDLYRSLLAVIRHGSLSSAARTLKATQPTLGRHIEALEQGLGVSLFSRSPAGLIPTEAALALVPFAEAMETNAAALSRTASGARTEVGGTVRIAASQVMGAEVLPAILCELQQAEPALIIELVLNNRLDNLLRRDADIAVRMVRPTQDGLVARRIGNIEIGLYAHSSYLARHAPPKSISDLKDHILIGYDRDDQALRSIRAGGVVPDREAFSFRTDSDLAQLAALRAGVGIAACQLRIAARDTNLVRVLKDRVSFSLEMWLAMHKDQRAVRPVRTAFDHLADSLAGWVA